MFVSHGELDQWSFGCWNLCLGCPSSMYVNIGCCPNCGVRWKLNFSEIGLVHDFVSSGLRCDVLAALRHSMKTADENQWTTAMCGAIVFPVQIVQNLFLWQAR